MLNNKVIVVTGADGGLGSAVTSTLAALGASLVVSTFLEEHATEIANGIRAAGGDAAPHHGDLTDPAVTDRLGACIQQRSSRLDGVVHTVGGFAFGQAVHNTPASLWQKMMDLNFHSALGVARVCVPILQAGGGGSIVHVAAQAALQGATQMGAYCASKSALIRITESMARELAPDAIRANAILPHIIDTPANRKAMPDSDPSAWVTPASIAGVIAFLLSDHAADVTAASIPVCGRTPG